MFFRSKNKQALLGDLGKASLLGIHLVSCTFVGFAIGYFLDKWLGTEPWFLIGFLFFGIAAGFKNMYLEAKKIHEEERKRDQGLLGKDEQKG
ncbi:MAG: AtpZ/AtpI family protein [Desulfonatronovibrio sp. MSAO_Bac4]|nr:MAG: AtpZ/AtpI family protein [Desulfonatronovibrio sp. MSAO_Bac4]